VNTKCVRHVWKKFKEGVSFVVDQLLKDQELAELGKEDLELAELG